MSTPARSTNVLSSSTKTPQSPHTDPKRKRRPLKYLSVYWPTNEVVVIRGGEWSHKRYQGITAASMIRLDVVTLRMRQAGLLQSHHNATGWFVIPGGAK